MSRVLLRSEGSLEAHVAPAAIVLPPGARAAGQAAGGCVDGMRMPAGVGDLEHVFLLDVELQAGLVDQLSLGNGGRVGVALEAIAEEGRRAEVDAGEHLQPAWLDVGR